VEELARLIGDAPTTTALLDRFFLRAEIIEIAGGCHRLTDIRRMRREIERLAEALARLPQHDVKRTGQG